MYSRDEDQWLTRMAAALVQQRPLSTVATADWDRLLANLGSPPPTYGGLIGALTASQTLSNHTLAQLGLGAANDLGLVPGPPLGGLNQLGLGAAYDLGLLTAPQIPPPLPQWIAVRRRFALFHKNLLLTP
jgi:hypothetical protein